jgi:hypothetical protein
MKEVLEINQSDPRAEQAPKNGGALLTKREAIDLITFPIKIYAKAFVNNLVPEGVAKPFDLTEHEKPKAEGKGYRPSKGTSSKATPAPLSDLIQRDRIQTDNSLQAVRAQLQKAAK